MDQGERKAYLSSFHSSNMLHQIYSSLFPRSHQALNFRDISIRTSFNSQHKFFSFFNFFKSTALIKTCCSSKSEIFMVKCIVYILERQYFWFSFHYYLPKFSLYMWRWVFSRIVWSLQFRPKLLRLHATAGQCIITMNRKMLI